PSATGCRASSPADTDPRPLRIKGGLPPDIKVGTWTKKGIELSSKANRDISSTDGAHLKGISEFSGLSGKYNLAVFGGGAASQGVRREPARQRGEFSGQRHRVGDLLFDRPGSFVERPPRSLAHARDDGDKLIATDERSAHFAGRVHHRIRERA